MRKSGYDIFLTIFLVILTVGVVGTAGYLVYKYYEKYKINTNANEFIDEQLDPVLEDRRKITEENEPDDEENNENNGGGTGGISGDRLTYGGYTVDGKLEMPSVNLQYPVLSQMTDANAIEVSVAIQYGVGLNNVGNTVIIGHNYRNGLFFGSNKRLQIGDKIYITDWASGVRREYEIYDKYTVEEADTSYYNRDTAGKREVSLVTCQSNNSYRLVVLAREV